ncbi:malonic semialdehyde reductase [Nonomuraea sp. SYSU D8015]|uniref:malonic semialdehyde reductase n=1 Tax=Nonomuraea sp. SYSU D8015 TaxID=2593644 RepID=UPI001CB73E31|nr:malonic semialdehyde reductase [Nonomuraea sp. SYSU D8015]
MQVAVAEGAPGLLLDGAAQDLLFREARTIEDFTNAPVTDEQVQAIYDLIKYGPTSMNQQPLRIVLLRSAAAKGAAIRWMLGVNKARTAAAPLTALLAADLRFHERLPELFPAKPDAARLFEDPFVREESARFNAALQIAYFILGVRAAGLAAAPTLGFDAEGIDKEFFGDGRHTILTVLNMGRPAAVAVPPRLPRLAFRDVVTVM